MTSNTQIRKSPSGCTSSDSVQSELFRRIQSRDYLADTELYRLIGGAIRAKCYSREKTDSVGDRVVFEEVLQAVRTGAIREPGDLIPYVRATIRQHMPMKKAREYPATKLQGNNIQKVPSDAESSTSDFDSALQIR